MVQKINFLDEPEANSQIDKLANFIMSEVEGEPSQSQSTVDTAIRIIKSYQDKEMLSQEWIDEHKRGYDEYPSGAPVLLVDDVEDLLVSKNELPVIPKFVAEWMEKYIEYGYDLYPALKKMENNARAWMKTYNWYKKNTLKFVNAYLTGEYKLEKEPLYRARLKIITNEFTYSYLNTQSSDSGERLKAFEIGTKYINEDFRHLSEFTEDELRVIGIWGSEQWEIEEVEE